MRFHVGAVLVASALSACGTSLSARPGADAASEAEDASRVADASSPDADTFDAALTSDAELGPDAGCASECVPGARRCEGTRVQTCESRGECGTWGAAADCPADEACLVEGRCLPVSDTILFVATDGDDAWSGSLATPSPKGDDGPLATLTGARDRLRKLRTAGALTAGARVLVREGTYPQEGPVVLEAKDSGKPGAPTIIEAYPGQRPLISGGRAVPGWKAANGRWTVALPDVAAGKWWFSALWMNGQRRTRARSPNQGYFYTAGTVKPDATHPDWDRRAFKFGNGDIQQFQNLADAEVEIFHAWCTSRQRIASVDLQNNVVEFTGLDRAYESFGPRQRYVVENVPEALDEPGEWYLDRATGVLSYLPLPGEKLEDLRAIAPVATQWLKFTGTATDPVHDLEVRDLRFAHADWLVGPKGVPDGQAATVMGAAIEATHARAIELSGLEVAHANGYGVWWRTGSQACAIRRSELTDLGGGGVRIGETAETATDHVTVDNCWIHDAGKVLKGAIGVWIGRSSFNQVLHNEISDLFYSGVSVGWSWGYAASTAHDNVVAHNHIHHLGQGVLSDMGGIYTLGVSPGTRLLHNHIHDVQDFSYGGWGLYTDEGSSQIELRDNLVHSTRSAPFHQHYGEDNLVANNILAFGGEGQLRRSREHADDQHSFDIKNNLVVSNDGWILEGVWSNGLFTREKNLYWDVNAPALLQCRTLAEVQASGQDLGSVIADPLFVDPTHFDFRLKPESPVTASVGFVPFSLDDFGLYGDEEWTARPGSIARGPSYLPAWPPAADLSEGFEGTAVGSVPALLTVQGVKAGASIAVTAEQARTGTQALKLQDAKGLDPTWTPYCYFQPKIRSGKVTATFALWRSAGARLFVEERDDRSPYVAGPTLRVSETGALTASNKSLGVTVPPETWTRFTTTATLGRATGLYDLTVQVADQPAKEFHGLGAQDAAMCNLSWFGFVADGDADSVVYLDDVSVNTAH